MRRALATAGLAQTADGNPPAELAIGVDLSGKAGHRSEAICIRQASGG